MACPLQKVHNLPLFHKIEQRIQFRSKALSVFGGSGSVLSDLEMGVLDFWTRQKDQSPLVIYCN